MTVARATEQNDEIRAGFITSTLVGGLLFVVPVYLVVLLLLKGMKSVATLLRPFTALLPDWVPAERLLSLLVVLTLCFLVAYLLRTQWGRGPRAPRGRAVRKASGVRLDP
jgi:hypothetical protein